MSNTTRRFLMAAAGGKKSTYVDDVFSTYAYLGNGSNRNIVNGVDNTEGGLVWTKARTANYSHILVDTERGTNKYLSSSGTASQVTDAVLTSFNNNGYGLSGSADVNRHSNYPFVGWNFRKAPGFFDIVTWSGNGVNGRQIPHKLGSVPGLIILKSTNSGGEPWYVYHQDLGATKHLKLNTTNASTTSDEPWNNTEPTSTHFTVAQYNSANGSGNDYIAYVFAGGESTAATARSVDFDGSGDYLSLGSTTDLNLTGDFTIEFWVYPRNQATGTRQSIIQTGSWGSQYTVVQISHPSHVGKAMLWDYDMNSSAPIITSNKQIQDGQWTHVAFTRSSGTIKIWINGTLDKTETGLSDSIEFGHATAYIANHSSSYYLNAQLSNFRIVKGTAVYTSSFKPPTEPLTNITNTKLLCCNNSSTTGSTVTPGTITANGNPTAITDSPFDDPEGFQFGEGGDQNIIKCGSYITDSNEDANVYLGWEPSWVLVKRTDSSSGGADWMIVDSIRGFPNAQEIQANTGGQSNVLAPNLNDAENNTNRLGLTSTGFYADQYGPNRNWIYMAIRRPDPLVGKPPEAGTDVFNVANYDSTAPAFNANFAVDFAMFRRTTSSYDWRTSARLILTKYLRTNTTDAETTENDYVFDYNDGWNKQTGYANTEVSWMWKRGAGFDVLAYAGLTGGKDIAHSLGKTPEMYWIKSRTSGSQEWFVYHKGLNGGSNPEGYNLQLQSSGAEGNSGSAFWYAPTSTHLRLKSFGGTNFTGSNYIAMLFASVDGISKVGYYDGTASSNPITVGFQPRFVFVKCTSTAASWVVWDTLRGFTASDVKYLLLDSNNPQGTANVVEPTSTGFTLTGTSNSSNGSGQKYIYYAHA